MNNSLNQFDKETSDTIENDEIKNKIAKILRGIGAIIVICGFVAGFIVSYDIIAMIIMWLGSVLVCIFMFGFAEIIHILHGIREKVYNVK